MAGINCVRCKQGPIAFDEKLTCISCKRSFHSGCLGLKPDRQRFVQSLGSGMFPICGECDLNARIAALEREVSQLCRDLRVAREQSTPEASESLAFEITDRIRRSKNLIVYNLPESLEANEECRLEDDKLRISTEILLFCFIDCTNISVQRIGKHFPNVPRPLRVYLNNEHDVHIVLKYRSNCSSGLRFKVDKTAFQRKVLQEAKATLQSLKDQGYRNKTVKYIRGAPVIVDIQPVLTRTSTFLPVLKEEEENSSDEL